MSEKPERLRKNRCTVCLLRIANIYNATLHEFPKDIETRRLWLKACGYNINKPVSPSLKVCSKHFENYCFEWVPKPNSNNGIQKVLKPNAVPTKFNNMSIPSHISGNCGPSSSEGSSGLIASSSGPSPDSSGPIPGSSGSSNASNNQLQKVVTIKDIIESSRVPIVFNNMLDDWEPFKWDINHWKAIFYHHPLQCRKGKITCTKEPLWERHCSYQNSSFSELDDYSETIKTHGNWLYFDYKYIGDKIRGPMFDSISWNKFGYAMRAEDSTVWIGSAGAHTPCHQDLYGINLVAQVYGKKRWILMSPDMDKYLEPTRIPYEESSNYSKINFSCPENIKKINKECKYVSIVLSPGDVLFVPHKWWHYVENLTTAVSINAWIKVPKYDNMARLKESVVRFMTSSVCNVRSDVIKLQLLNPNEKYTSNMAPECCHLIDECIKVIKSENNTTTDEPTQLDPTLFPTFKYKALQPDQYLCRGEFDTVYHRIHHPLKVVNPPSKTDIGFKLLDAFCSENVINEVVKNLLQ